MRRATLTSGASECPSASSLRRCISLPRAILGLAIASRSRLSSKRTCTAKYPQKRAAIQRRNKPAAFTRKGFVKGDPRINRNGRPRSFDELRKLAQAIANETTTDNHGNKITTAEAILRSWMRSKQSSLQKAFIEYAFGKVPDKLETNPLESRHRRASANTIESEELFSLSFSI